MIFVDSSVWIQYFRGKDEELIRSLNNLLDQDQVALATPVLVELLSGARAVEIPKLQRVFSALPQYRPSEKCWGVMPEWVEHGLRKGQRFGFPDLLIGGIASEYDAAIWSLDADFSRMGKLGLIELHR